MNRITPLILLTSLTSLTYGQNLVPVEIIEGRDDDLFMATGETPTTEAPIPTTGGTGDGRIPNDPQAVSFINLIQSNNRGPNCMTGTYGIEIAYSESITNASIRLYSGFEDLIDTSAPFDLVGNETIKQFHGIEYDPDLWTTVMYVEFGYTVNGEYIVHQLVHFGSPSEKPPAINGINSLEITSDPLVKGDISFIFKDSTDTPAEGGWVREDFSWEPVIGNADVECFWEKANDGQSFRGQEQATTTTAPGGPSGSVTHSAGLAFAALLSIAGMM
eukprot:GHVN01095315.1.p1 GENE.GHVN01095315.1~~GHVN01095315.1.p1  ORF type:complete len:310 (-),score=31.58 GHVN01095315.1:550-1371(-)